MACLPGAWTMFIGAPTLNAPCRYAFRSTEKVALQEIGPRFTLKLRYMKKGLPAVKNLGAPSKHLEFDAEEHEQEKLALKDIEMGESAAQEQDEEGEKEPEPPKQKKVVPPTEDEYLWIWKVRIFFIGVAMCADDLVCSRSWRLQGGRSSCRRLSTAGYVSYALFPNDTMLPPRFAVHYWDATFGRPPAYRERRKTTASRYYGADTRLLDR